DLKQLPTSLVVLEMLLQQPKVHRHYGLSSPVSHCWKMRMGTPDPTLRRSHNPFPAGTQKLKWLKPLQTAHKSTILRKVAQTAIASQERALPVRDIRIELPLEHQGGQQQVRPPQLGRPPIARNRP